MAPQREPSEQRSTRPGGPLLIAIVSLPLTFGKDIVWTVKAVWNEPRSADSLDRLLLTVGPLAVVLFEQILARLRWQSSIGKPPVIVHDWTTDHVLNAGLVAAFCLLCGYTARVWWHRYQVTGGPSPTRERGLTNIMRAFLLGTAAGMAVRLYLGDVSVHDFATGSSPIMAGLLFGTILVRTEGPANLRTVDISREVQLGAIYVLIGSIATALGTIPASGWFFGTCFLIICGSLAAAAYLVLSIAMR